MRNEKSGNDLRHRKSSVKERESTYFSAYYVDIEKKNLVEIAKNLNFILSMKKNKKKLIVVNINKRTDEISAIEKK